MDKDKALNDPASVFAEPQDVCRETHLSQEEKIRILRQWEYDAREMQVADEENMAGGDSDQLDQVLAALHELGQTAQVDTPSKQGGE
ncbi:hypothetical protein QQM79_10230 [Marinobacteraceae bacterium S3BR75-40.1]